MKKLLAVAALGAGMLTVAGPLFAHHSRGATLRHEEAGHPQGHCHGSVVAQSARGDLHRCEGDRWQGRQLGVRKQQRQHAGQAGYNRNTLRVGQEITAIVNPSAKGAPRGIVVKVILPDGKEIMSRETGANPVD